jgi:rod shape-determining protein MreB
MPIFGAFTQDVAVDLGCSTVRVYVRGKGLVAVEPNLVAARKSGPNCGEVLSVGAEAAQMIGRTPQEVAVVRPVRGGGTSIAWSRCSAISPTRRDSWARFAGPG